MAKKKSKLKSRIQGFVSEAQRKAVMAILRGKYKAKKNELVLFHGTTKGRVKGIEQYGLKAGRSSFAEKSLPPRKKYVWLTPDPRHAQVFFAEMEPGEGATFAVRVPTHKVRKDTREYLRYDSSKEYFREHLHDRFLREFVHSGNIPKSRVRKVSKKDLATLTKMAEKGAFGFLDSTVRYRRLIRLEREREARRRKRLAAKKRVRKNK